MTQLHHICRTADETYSLQSKLLAGSDEQDPLLEKVQGVESVTISLDPEVLVSTDLRQSLIRGKIRRMEQIKMLPL